MVVMAGWVFAVVESYQARIILLQVAVQNNSSHPISVLINCRTVGSALESGISWPISSRRAVRCVIVKR